MRRHFFSFLGLVLAWISSLKVPLLSSGSSCLLKTILLSDLVGCYSLLQKVMAVLHTFFKFKVLQTAINICRGLSQPNQQN
jgi:hypothetical protein